MKTFLPLLALVGFAVSAQAQTPSPAPKFEWKLRLTKGQTWTQTYEARGTMRQSPPSSRGKPSHDILLRLRQTLVLRNEVLFANPDFLVLRATFVRFEQTTSINDDPSLHTPDRSKFTQAFIGVPFKIRRALDGRLLAVSGLKVLVERGQKSLDALAKSQDERAELQRFLPTVEVLSGTLNTFLSVPFPAQPSNVAESRFYTLESYPSFLLGDKIKVKRVLRSFDGQVARFDERGTFQMRDVQVEPEDNSRTFDASTGILTGQTTVDASTGLPQSEFLVSVNSKTSNQKRTVLVSRENTHITVSMKLEP